MLVMKKLCWKLYICNSQFVGLLCQKGPFYLFVTCMLKLLMFNRKYLFQFSNLWVQNDYLSGIHATKWRSWWNPIVVERMAFITSGSNKNGCSSWRSLYAVERKAWFATDSIWSSYVCSSKLPCNSESNVSSRFPSETLGLQFLFQQKYISATGKSLQKWYNN